MGSNMAEDHPVGFQWVMEAKRCGAKVIHVDPRFTRTSAMAHLHVPIRAGTDIVFLGALIRHVLENGHEFREYVRYYTNARAIISEDFRDTEDLDGLFSGWNENDGKYEDIRSWQYKDVSSAPGAADRDAFSGEPSSERGTQLRPQHHDPTLQHPKCVFQILKHHF